MKKTAGFAVVLLLFVAYLFYDALNEKGVHKEVQHAKEITLRLGYNIPEESVLHQAAVRFAKIVHEKSQGRVVVEVYPNQILGNDHQMTEMARLGELDMVLIPTAKMSVAIPSMQYADLPFYFPSRKDVYEMLDGEVGRMLLERLSQIDLVGITIWDNGFKHFTGNTPLRTIEDFAGKNIRVMKSRILMEQFRLLGANPIPIDFHETRAALKDKAVDGQENPLVAIYTMDIHSVQNNMTLSEHGFLGYVLSISSKVYEKLPMEVQNLILESALEVTPWEREQTKLKEKEFLEKIAASGIQIEHLEEQERLRFKTLMQNIPKKFEEIIGSDILSKSDELLYDKYKNEEDEVVIGLDLDLSSEIDRGGLTIKRGAELALEEINARGGLLGKKVVLLAKDNRALASKGAENIREFLRYPNLLALVGGIHSAIIQEEIPVFAPQGVPMLLSWSVHDALTQKSNNVFRVSGRDALLAEVLIEHAKRNGDSIGILYENSLWGRSSFETMERFLAQTGQSFAYAGAFNRGQTDFSAQIGALHAKGVEVLVMIANPKESTSIVLEIGLLERAPAIVSHWGILGGDFFEQTKHVLHRIDLSFFQTFIFCKNASSKAKEVMERYERNYEHLEGDSKNLAFAVLQTYDAVMLLAEAVQHAKSFEHAKVVKALEEIGLYKGAIKEYVDPFGAGEHEGLDKADYRMGKFDPKGNVVPLEGCIK